LTGWSPGYCAAPWTATTDASPSPLASCA
jgi:hypothetical protein